MELLGGAPGLGGGMNASPGAERGRIEALRAERHARDARRTVFAKCAALDGARVRFQSHLEVGRQREMAPCRVQHPADGVRGEQARRAAAEEDADRFPPGDLRRLRLEIARQSPEVGLLRKRSEEHTSELQSPCNLVCRLLLEKKKKT